MPCQSVKEPYFEELLRLYVTEKIYSLWESDDSAEDDADDGLEDEVLAPLSEDAFWDLYDKSIQSDSKTIEKIMQTRYLNERRPIEKTAKNLRIILSWREDRLELFHIYACMEPETFNHLVSILSSHHIFQNDSAAPQIEPELHILVALRRFGTYGNVALVDTISHWVGVGTGTIELITKRVMIAVLESNLQAEYIYWPSLTERKDHKARVEEISIPEWRDGWAMVDSILIPIYSKLHYFRDRFFNRKKNYSMNLQITSTPDLHIVDYATGFIGSQSDSHCFRETRLAKE
ncbi:hypothetical protein RUND412_008462 [Rhizina undulata]